MFYTHSQNTELNPCTTSDSAVIQKHRFLNRFIRRSSSLFDCCTKILTNIYTRSHTDTDILLYFIMLFQNTIFTLLIVSDAQDVRLLNEYMNIFISPVYGRTNTVHNTAAKNWNYNTNTKENENNRYNACMYVTVKTKSSLFGITSSNTAFDGILTAAFSLHVDAAAWQTPATSSSSSSSSVQLSSVLITSAHLCAGYNVIEVCRRLQQIWDPLKPPRHNFHHWFPRDENWTL